MSNIVIYNKNVDLFLFENDVPFSSTDDIDKYISDVIIPELLKNDFDRVFIKDNLSSNYLELVGLRVAYHIRLSKELGKKRFIPIIILSDLDSHTLNKLEPMAKILFTKSIFIIPNTKVEIEKFKTKKLKNLTDEEYREKFLNLITVEAPKDYTDDHDIANEWSIHLWAKYLKVETDSIKINNQNIESALYFKYLKSLYLKNEKNKANYKIKKLNKKNEREDEKSKILYVDDEWNKGWSDILGTLFPDTNNIEFTTFRRIKQDAKQKILIPMIRGEVKRYDPDVVILDLRLVASDHNDNADLDTLTGIQLVQEIKKINPGIQIIMLTATGKSVILERLYSNGILGYIKKEHPNDRSISTTENINKLVGLVDQGFAKSYLKKIWTIQNKLITLNMILNAEKERDNLNTHIKGKSINLYELQENKLSEESEKLLELKSTILMMYEILDSNIKKKFSYSVLTIFKCLEIVSDYYIKEESKTENKKRIFYAIWKHNNKIISQKGNCSVNNKLSNVINKVFIETNKDLNQNKNKIVCTRNAIIHPDTIMPSCENKVIAEDDLNEEDILNWFEMLNSILDKMDIFESSRSLDTEA